MSDFWHYFVGSFLGFVVFYFLKLVCQSSFDVISRVLSSWLCIPLSDSTSWSPNVYLSTEVFTLVLSSTVLRLKIWSCCMQFDTAWCHIGSTSMLSQIVAGLPHQQTIMHLSSSALCACNPIMVVYPQESLQTSLKTFIAATFLQMRHLFVTALTL